MADLGFAVNTDELPDAKEFSPIPVGDYTVLIVNSNLLPTNKTKDLMKASGATDYEAYRKTNAKAEGYLQLEMDIQGPTQAGRKLFHNLNLINDSQQAAEIAAGQLKQILEAMGMKTFSGKTEELHNKRLGVSVEIRAGKDYQKDGKTVPGQPQNNCKKFFAPGTAIANTATAQATSGGAAKGPWSR